MEIAKPTKETHPVLRLGKHGPAVTDLQNRLGGCAPDGDFGPATRERVREWQKEHGLPVSGIVNDDDWVELMKP